MGLKMKNFYIMAIHQFLGEGVTKKQNRGNCIKRGAWTICRGCGKKEKGGCF